jgi:membrane peptidoglycan carboxypeptidase
LALIPNASDTTYSSRGIVVGSYTGARTLGLDRLPDPAVVAVPLASDTVVYDRTDRILLGDLHPPGYQHIEAPLWAMGRWLPAATVAADDPGFWTEAGGSTITRHLVRLRLPGVIQNAGFEARARDASMAALVEMRFSKSRVLELYLNVLYYGNTAYGAEAAARVYFGVGAGSLDLAQAALLAGLVSRPTLTDPFRSLPAAQREQRRVLDAMVARHDIGRQEADAALGETLRLADPAASVRAPDLVRQVSDSLSAALHLRDLTRAGLHVVSTLDWDLQQQAVRSLGDAVRAAGSSKVGSGALVAIDPQTAEVLALVGSVNRTIPNGQYDLSDMPRNPGTSFRMFTYAAAIASKRYTMVTPLTDGPLTVSMTDGGHPYSPRNFDLHFHGTCDLQTCLGNGLNVPAVEVELAVGVPKVVRIARAMGAPPWIPHFQPSGSVEHTDDDPEGTFGPALTPGGYGETAVQMAAAASVLASGGMARRPRLVRSLRAAAGAAVPVPGASTATRAIDEETAFIVSQMLSDDANRTMIYGRGSPLVLPGRRVAALAGTTAAFTDAWTVGYTPSLATAVWMGNPDQRPMVTGSDGVFVAAPAWNAFMGAALDQLRRGDEWFSPPAGLQQAEIGGRTAWFLEGTSALTSAPDLPNGVKLAAA